METEIQHFIELENARNTNEGFDYENLINKDGHQRVMLKRRVVTTRLY